MRKFALKSSLVILFLAFGMASAQAQNAANIAGTYRVMGTNPGSGSQYQGTATIVKDADKYRIHWNVGTVYDGVGTLKGDTLTVEWGTATSHVGTVTYTLQKDGVLKGTWYDAKDPKTLGTENLTPSK